MNIAYVCDEYPPQPVVGGIGVFTHTLAHALADAGHRVTVVGTGKQPGERDDRGVRVVTLAESTRRGVAWLIGRRRIYRWLKQAVRAGNIDIIETPEFHGLLPFTIRGCPVVVRLHLNSTTIARNAGQTVRPLHRWLEKRTLSAHANWIAVSRYILEETVGEYNVVPDRSTIIYNPVEKPTAEVGVPSELPEKYLIYVGTLSDRKGAYVLAEAARSFLLSDPELHVVYVGAIIEEGDLRSDQRIRRIVGKELAPRVHCLGFLDHATAIACMKRARVLAFPSRLESFGLVPVEAMSCGVPVVYSTLHAGPEVIDDGVTGLLADPHDPNDVAEKVQRLLNDTAFAAQLAENAREAVKDRFSLQRCVDETIAFYTVILREQK